MRRPGWPQVVVVLVSVALAAGLAWVRPDPLAVPVRAGFGDQVSLVDGLDVRFDSAALTGGTRTSAATRGSGGTAQSAYVLVPAVLRCGANASGMMSYAIVSGTRSYSPLYSTAQSCRAWTQVSWTIVFTVQPDDLDGAHLEVRRMLGLSSLERVITVELGLDGSDWEQARYQVATVADARVEGVS